MRIDVTTAMTVISEIGTDMSRFATVKHFTSWLGLCPGTKISGGKVLGAATKRSVNRATQALSHMRALSAPRQTQRTSTTDMTPNTTVPLAFDSVQVCPAGGVTTVTL